MADPLLRPLKWSKSYQTYVEKHNIYRVFQDVLKQIVITKPSDPLMFVRDRLPTLAKGIFSPRVFVISSQAYGAPGVKQVVQKLAASVKAQFLTVDDIIESSNSKRKISFNLTGQDTRNEEATKLLCSLVKNRISSPDCEAEGYVLFGFPQSKAQALCAQQMGILPRSVLVLLPDTSDNNQDEYEITRVEDYGESPHFGPNRDQAQIMQAQSEAAAYSDIATAYKKGICKVIPYDQTTPENRYFLESELYEALLTRTRTNAPFIPRILVLGGPCSGKTFVANYLRHKFSVVSVNWVELVRGAARWTDEIADEAKAYLSELTPMSEESVNKILSKRLMKEDCEKKGWVLRGFPEGRKHCEILKQLSLEPNRVFVLSCDYNESLERLAKKKKEVLQRKLKGITPGKIVEDNNLLFFPYSEISVATRFFKFSKSLEEIIPYYAPQIIYVDSSLKPDEVKDFVETSVIEPPIFRT